MVKIKVDKGKKKSMTVKPADLISSTLVEIVSDKLGKEVTNDSILSFDGKKVEYIDGDSIEFSIPEKELLDVSISQWAQKKLKSRAKLNITVLKSGN